MPVTYYEEYSAKKLNEVVLLGSHDAGIHKGNANTRTQSEGIKGQALKGARFFDLRIGAFASNKTTGGVSLRAYHDDTRVPDDQRNKLLQTLNTRDRHGVHVPKPAQDVFVQQTRLGAKGGGLYGMLGEARAFVTDGATANEFLILKFDQCTNWKHIAEACIEMLDGVIYQPEGDKTNLNECTLEDLRGRVVVLFSKDGCDNCGITTFNRYKLGILQWKNLYDKQANEAGGYSQVFHGLQYYGKGGVSAEVLIGESRKIKANIKAQTSLMEGKGEFKTVKTEERKSSTGNHAGVSPAVVGLMYWTTTGPSAKGIEHRNKKMWTTKNQKLLVDCTRLAQEMLPSNVNVESGGSANTVKQFMPNIVMVDFVTEYQGRLVKALNTKSGTEILGVINGNGNGNGNNHNGHNNV